MTPAELDAAQALVDVAAPGPWLIAQDGDVTAPNAEYALVCNDARPRDAAFIAAARTLVPALIAAVRERDAILRALVDALPKCDECMCANPATRAEGRGGSRYCDTHGIGRPERSSVPEYPRAAPLRAAVALLAGKP